MPIIWQDDWFVAVRKPWGIHVHPSALSPGETSLIQLLQGQLGAPVHPLHRLDRAASGLLLLARSAEAASLGGRLFRERLVDKTYRVILRGWLPEPVVCDSPVVMDGEGGEGDCSTWFEPLVRYCAPFAVGKFPELRLCQCRVRMAGGRRHQIRIHAARLSHPVLGDTSHGCRHHNHLASRLWPPGRLQLACDGLGWVHPVTGARMELTDDPGGHAGWLGGLLEEYKLT